MDKKKYFKSELPQEAIEELFLEITGKKLLLKEEMHRLDAFFEKDENGNIALYYYDSTQLTENK
jgi:hypothetical protein